MNADQLLAEIREANLSYLMLAQNLIRTDREQAPLRLGINDETATLIERSSPAQIEDRRQQHLALRLPRKSDDLVWSLLTSHGRRRRRRSGRACTPAS